MLERDGAAPGAMGTVDIGLDFATNGRCYTSVASKALSDSDHRSEISRSNTLAKLRIPCRRAAHARAARRLPDERGQHYVVPQRGTIFNQGEHSLATGGCSCQGCRLQSATTRARTPLRWPSSPTSTRS